MIMSRSDGIIQEDMDYCIVCGRYGTEIHHIFYGTANRKLSTKYGLICGLCYDHHRGKYGVHNGNSELDKGMKQMAQRRFIETYPNEDFLRIFGKNYL